MGSSMSHLRSRRSLTRFACANRESSPRASHPLGTKPGGQCRIGCAKNLVGEQRSGARSEAGCGRYKSQHHGGNKPRAILTLVQPLHSIDKTYPHSSMKRSCDFIILLQSRTASQNLRQPELSDCSLHMSNLPLSGGGCLDPLRWLSSDTADHVRMSEGLRCTLLRLYVQCGGNWLSDSGVQRGGPAWDDQVLVCLVARPGTAFTVSSPRSDEGGMIVQRWAHDCRFQSV